MFDKMKSWLELGIKMSETDKRLQICKCEFSIAIEILTYNLSFRTPIEDKEHANWDIWLQLSTAPLFSDLFNCCWVPGAPPDWSQYPHCSQFAAAQITTGIGSEMCCGCCRYPIPYFCLYRRRYRYWVSDRCISSFNCDATTSSSSSISRITSEAHLC